MVETYTKDTRVSVAPHRLTSLLSLRAEHTDSSPHVSSGAPAACQALC